MTTRQVRISHLRELYEQGKPITVLTAYDATFARLFDSAGVDALLVGDSLANVVQGLDTTVPVTVEHMIYHSAAVARGAKRAHIVTDLPFLSYGANEDEAIQNAGRLMKEGGAHAVKLEGGEHMASTIRRMVDLGIPVMGHLGLTPQSVHALGGFRVQGRGDEQAARLLRDAKALQDAGVYAIVLEMIPGDLAEKVTEELDTPTIGIGAGNQTSGQVLVGYDMLGLNDGFQPRFLKRFAEQGADARAATEAFIDEVRRRSYPGKEHSFS